MLPKFQLTLSLVRPPTSLLGPPLPRLPFLGLNTLTFHFRGYVLLIPTPKLIFILILTYRNIVDLFYLQPTSFPSGCSFCKLAITVSYISIFLQFCKHHFIISNCCCIAFNIENWLSP